MFLLQMNFVLSEIKYKFLQRDAQEVGPATASSINLNAWVLFLCYKYIICSKEIQGVFFFHILVKLTKFYHQKGY